VRQFDKEATWAVVKIGQSRKLIYRGQGKTKLSWSQSWKHPLLQCGNHILMQSNLCTTATLGTPNLRPFLTCGRCSEVDLKLDSNWNSKIVIAGNMQVVAI
jgi:hypothetical protein